MYKRFFLLVTVMLLLYSLLFHAAASLADSGFVMSGVNLATDEELEDAFQQIMAEKQSRIRTTIVLNAAEVSITKGKTQKLSLHASMPMRIESMVFPVPVPPYIMTFFPPW